jgi:hypothetical protein
MKKNLNKNKELINKQRSCSLILFYVILTIIIIPTLFFLALGFFFKFKITIPLN